MTLSAAEAAQLDDLREIKQHLDMNYVMERFGHHPDVVDNEKAHYYSPFREEDRPSFDVFYHQIKGREEPEQRYGDFADPNLNQGDVFDLIMLFTPGQSRAAAIADGQELLVEQIRSGWQSPTAKPQSRKELQREAVFELLRRGDKVDATSSETWYELARSKPGLNYDYAPDVLRTMPGKSTLMFPLYDADGELQGVRYRRADGTKYGEDGTKNVLMRMGAPREGATVFLAEGETDTWAAHMALGPDGYEVMGVPGVGNHPQKVAGEELDNRTVVLCFDPDPAGRSGTAAWAHYLVERGCNVSVVVMPEGTDVAELRPEEIRDLPDAARSFKEPPEDVQRIGNEYHLIRNVEKGITESLSTFALDVVSRLRPVGGGPAAYEVLIRPSGRRTVITFDDLASAKAFTRWAAEHDEHFTGAIQHALKIHRLIACEAVMAPDGMITDQVGLTSGVFVGPEGLRIGKRPVWYVEPTTSVGLTKADVSPVQDRNAPANRRVKVFEHLYHSQESSVTGPFLAWLAAAPLRSRFREFPILAVNGSSGSGKTALTERFVTAFTGSHITTNLTSTTPNAVTGYLACSNGFPVHFDEYRPGASTRAKNTLDQMLRDAYTAQASSKGGQDRSDLNKIEKLRTDSPLVITGEDYFTETSHTDRMVQIALDGTRKGPLDLRVDVGGFAWEYLSFLTKAPVVDVEEAPVWEDWIAYVEAYKGEFDSLRPRQAVNMAVLRIGWRLLTDFLLEHDALYEMPELDLSAVIEAGEESGKTNPVLEAIRYCYERDGDLPLRPAVTYQDGVFVAPADLLALASQGRLPGIVLPGASVRALAAPLIELGAKKVRPSRNTLYGDMFGGDVVQVNGWHLPIEVVVGSEDADL